jgi:hypothetical protein
MLEPYARKVFVESPPSDDLPGFDHVDISSCDTEPKLLRHIYLRPGDTIHFEDESCAIHISAGKSAYSNTTSFAEGVDVFAATEVQVKSSVNVPVTPGPGAPDDNEDEDDLDGGVNTSLDAEDMTPTTSRPTDGLTVKDTPSRPFSRESNHVFSTAPDQPSPDSVGDAKYADSSTPAARAGAKRGKRAKLNMNSSEDGDSQHVFPTSKGQTTYGGTPKQKLQATMEIQKSPSKRDLSSQPLDGDTIKVVSEARRSSGRTQIAEDAAVTMSSPDRKRPHDDTDEAEGDELSAPTAKMSRGPRCSAGKTRGRPSKGSKVEDDEVVKPPSSSGKLKRPGRKSMAMAAIEDEDDGLGEVLVAVPRRKANVSPNLDPGASSIPQSSTTPLSGKVPTKILLSKSKFAADKKAENWLKRKGATIEDKKIPSKGVDFVCIVGSGELATTAKVVRSVALGKKVVTDEWLKDSMKQDQLLDLDGYVHDDLVDTMAISRSRLFGGKALFITKALEKTYGQGFADIKELATTVGSHSVEFGSSLKANSMHMSNSTTIFLGDDGDDPDALKLMQEDGRTVYRKNLLTQSIIRGELLIDEEEFKWKPRTAKGKNRKK